MEARFHDPCLGLFAPISCSEEEAGAVVMFTVAVGDRAGASL